MSDIVNRITPEILQSLYGRRVSSVFVNPLRIAMTVAQIETVEQCAAFLAQIGHESGRLLFMKEIWGPTSAQIRYEPVTSLSKRLGNTTSGDGKRYYGRGFIQITGRSNYRDLGAYAVQVMKVQVPDFEEHPEELEKPFWAAVSAGLYWRRKNLNKFIDNFGELTRRINGGYNGLADRQSLYTRALILLG